MVKDDHTMGQRTLDRLYQRTEGMNLRVGQTISEDRGHEPEGWTDYIRGQRA